MAKVMAFTDAAGNTYQTSYWRVVQINVSVADRTAMVMLYGYKDAASRQAGRSPIGQKSYAVTGADFDKLFASQAAQAFAALAYTGVVNAVNDVPDPNKPGQLGNFFADATDAL